MKIVIIGAGSGFGSRLSIDIMSRESLREATICLCDLHEERLKKVTAYIQNTIDKYNLPTKLESSTDRTKLLPGADFVITSVSVGGGAYYGFPYNIEVEIPRKYGIEQTVADTYSVGAAFRLMRTAPVQLQICREMEQYCPDAYLLNHTNPMAGLTMLHSTASSIKNVGICHGVQHTSSVITKFIGLKDEDVTYKVAGINHLAWFLEYQRTDTGEDLYPMLRDMLDNPQTDEQRDFLKKEAVRVEIMRKFGYFPTESNHHDSEYLPYFRRNADLMKQYFLKPRDPVRDSLGEKAREWLKDSMDSEHQLSGDLRMSNEYTSGIMEGIVTDRPFRFIGNVMNKGLITNLPGKLCVEVPCFADRHGINASVVGDLPTHLAGFNHANGTCVQLTVESILEKDKEKAFYAFALDPNAASILSLDNIRKMFEEMWEAEGDLLEWYWKDKITERYALN
ncbi:alpha-glucosidase/alpha-galactosidase [Paenibacillus sepulcri]|uniref:Alpha-glucosidase/alpha-galactosidase n=1 Tax=Paenibacillus sepulcri TaxID=359917 RepID=A0ABS7BWK1_9BACL|nr:alpha-glucosidase/alpha-galactosidase [Paenibacillus sepulcri]